MATPTVSIKWERTVSTKGSTRATAYMASNKIISHDGLIYATWLESPGRSMIDAFDESGEPIGAPQLLREGIDNHCGAALTVDQHGFLHAVCGSHNELPFDHRITRKPWSWDNWWTARPISDSPTYPSLVCGLDNRLHLTYRWWHNIAIRGGPRAYHVTPSLGYQRTRPGMNWDRFGHRRDPVPVWSDPASMVVPLVPNGYCQYGSSLAVDGLGRLHLGFHVYDQKYTERGHTVGYMMSVDGGETWTNARGDELTLPCGPTGADTLESDFDGDIETAPFDMRASNVAVTPEGNPLIVAFHREDGHATLWEAVNDDTKNGPVWRSTNLLPVLREHDEQRYFSMDGTVTVDAAGNTYVAAQTVSELGHWGDGDSEVVLLFRPAGTHAWQVVDISEHTAYVPNWHPSLERIASPYQTMGTPYLLYQHGTKGTGCETYDDTEVRLVALAVE